MEYPKTVAAYLDECEFVEGWLKPDWQDQYAFDDASFKWRTSDRMAHYRAYTPDTLMWVPDNGDLNLLVLQEFIRADLAEARENGGKIEYRRR